MTRRVRAAVAVVASVFALLGLSATAASAQPMTAGPASALNGICLFNTSICVGTLNPG
jgi:hypothetical protein